MEKVCCPKFAPTSWDGKSHQWSGKKFIKDHVFSIFYMPLNFGSVMKRMSKKVEESDASFSKEWLCLSDHTSGWNIDVLCEVDKEVPGAKNVEISGDFLSKVYEGPYSGMRKWCEDFKAFAKEKGKKIKKQYWWYTTCPKCAKKYGKNYVVSIAEVE